MSKAASSQAVDALAAEAAGASTPAGNTSRTIELFGPGGRESITILPPLDWAADIDDLIRPGSLETIHWGDLLRALRGMVEFEDQAIIDRVRPSNRCLSEVLLGAGKDSTESPGESPASSGS